MTDANDGTGERGGGGAGWTNERVRDGYDVDGSESRTVPVAMGTRVELNRMGAAVLGPALWWVLDRVYRPSYPLLRSVGDRLGRGAAVEQYVAEKEYVAATVAESERATLGSRTWLGGLGLVGGLLLLGFGGGFAAGTAAVDPAGAAAGTALPGLVVALAGAGLVAGAVAAASLASGASDGGVSPGSAGTE